MALSSLLYASTARPGLTSADIDRIVETAKRVNADLQITGMLAFDGTGFAQILEGESADIDRLIEKIRNDPRHTGCVVLSYGPIAARRFDSWTMAYRQLSDLIMIQDIVA